MLQGESSQKSNEKGKLKRNEDSFSENSILLKEKQRIINSMINPYKKKSNESNESKSKSRKKDRDRNNNIVENRDRIGGKNINSNNFEQNNLNVISYLEHERDEFFHQFKDINAFLNPLPLIEGVHAAKVHQSDSSVSASISASSSSASASAGVGKSLMSSSSRDASSNSRGLEAWMTEADRREQKQQERESRAPGRFMSAFNSNAIFDERKLTNDVANEFEDVMYAWRHLFGLLFIAMHCVPLANVILTDHAISMMEFVIIGFIPFTIPICIYAGWKAPVMLSICENNWMYQNTEYKVACSWCNAFITIGITFFLGIVAVSRYPWLLVCGAFDLCLLLFVTFRMFMHNEEGSRTLQRNSMRQVEKNKREKQERKAAGIKEPARRTVGQKVIAGQDDWERRW
jgi:hypothetical protein